MRKLLIAIAALTLGACSQPKEATEALMDAGYTNVAIQGYSFFGCGKGDDYSTGFTAIGQSGQCVKGVVCGGWFKGSTIRTQGRC